MHSQSPHFHIASSRPPVLNLLGRPPVLNFPGTSPTSFEFTSLPTGFEFTSSPTNFEFTSGQTRRFQMPLLTLFSETKKIRIKYELNSFKIILKTQTSVIDDRPFVFHLPVLYM